MPDEKSEFPNDMPSEPDSRQEDSYPPLSSADEFSTLPPRNEEDTLEDLSQSSSDVSELETIGPYKIIRSIGEGGMGSVFLASQTKPFRREVALKVIKSGTNSREVIARFEAERQALAMMAHPSIARILDAGETQNGQPFFAMELVEGVPVTQYCDENQLGIQERLSIFLQICEGIQHAHQKGIIHRDLKPSNVLVTEYEGKAVPKIIDFGLAKALETTEKLTDKTMQTQFGQILGTLQYMSPEQAEVDHLDIDTRTDVYSLGVILYELLTGSTPLDRAEMQGQALLRVLELIREKEPPRPSTRLSSAAHSAEDVSRIRQIQPSRLRQILRGDLDWVVMRALEKERDRRYETASAFAGDIRRFMTGEPVAAKPPTWSYRFSKFVRKNRLLVGFTTAIAITLVAATIVSTTFALEANRQSKIVIEKEKEASKQKEVAIEKSIEAVAKSKQAEAERVRANEEKEIAQEVRKFLQDSILGQSSVWRRANANLGNESTSGNNVTVQEVLNAASEKYSPKNIASFFPNRPNIQSEILETISEAYFALRDLDKSVEYATGAAEILDNAFGQQSPEAIKGRVNQYFAALTGEDYLIAANTLNKIVVRCHQEYEEANSEEQNEAQLANANAMLDEAIERSLTRMSPSRFAFPILKRDNISLQLGKAVFELDANFQKLTALMESLFGKDHDRTKYCEMFRAFSEYACGSGIGSQTMQDESVETLRKSIRWTNDWPEKHSLTRATFQLAFAAILELQNQDRADILELTAQSTSVIESQLGKAHPATLIFKIRLAHALFLNEKWERSFDTYRDALPDYILHLGTAERWPNFNRLASRLDRVEDAEATYRETIEKVKSVYGISGQTLIAMRMIPNLLEDTGNLDQAIEELREVVALAKSHFEFGNKFLMDTEQDLVATLLRADQDEEAVELMRTLLEKQKAAGDTDSANYRWNLRQFAHTASMGIDLPAAIAAFEEHIKMDIKLSGPRITRVRTDRFRLVEVFFELEKYSNALKYLDQLIADGKATLFSKQDPKLSSYKRVRTIVLIEAEEFGLALESAKEQIKIEESKNLDNSDLNAIAPWAESLFHASRSLKGLGQPELALDYLDESSELVPLNKMSAGQQANYLYLQGSCFLELGQNNKARQSLESAYEQIQLLERVTRRQKLVRKNERAILTELREIYRAEGMEEKADSIKQQLDDLEQDSKSINQRP